MAQNPTINLIDFRGYETRWCYDRDVKEPMVFKVEKIVNSIDHVAGSWMRKSTVKDLINFGWTVNVREPKDKDF